jgi:hypothetical protein
MDFVIGEAVRPVAQSADRADALFIPDGGEAVNDDAPV